ncbi:MAG: hypothetical protein JSV80_07745 [Acidobacteriota bacterium]|nr:MAG: hypothetical protein JSV80_07745 [Acidobacteriota bacterium]
MVARGESDLARFDCLSCHGAHPSGQPYQLLVTRL